MDATSFNLLLDREKEILRLIVRGYDTKAIARELQLSNNVINERLREVRKKLGVTSSREAARHLANIEQDPHKKIVHNEIGIVNPRQTPHSIVLPDHQVVNNGEALLTAHNEMTTDNALLFLLSKQLSLPFRKTGNVNNELSKTQRLIAIAEISVKLVAAVAVVFFIAAMINFIIINSSF
jgi:DNA-binding CsgD family transcriptional regulator